MFARAVHPGQILKEELATLAVSQADLARQIAVPPCRIARIIAGRQSTTGDTALRLGHWFGTGPHFWISLQIQFDLAAAERESGPAIRHPPTANQAQRPAVRLQEHTMSEPLAKIAIKPTRPGAFLRTVILEPLKLSLTHGAEVLGVPQAALSDLVNGVASLTPEMALRVEKAFGVDMAMLLNMRALHDIHTMRERADTITVERYSPGTP